jgi:3-oxoacyl-[acyl-carrier-protein] synthase-3
LPHGVIAAIEYYLPEQVLTTAELAAEFPEWQVEKIDKKTGIHTRHIAAPDECSSDLAVKAAEKLFASGVCRPEQIDYILFCTQTPDYLVPTTACLIQHRLGIPTHAGALDFNLACSAYVYGLGIAEGLITTGQARNILFLTAETYTKLIHPQDRSVRTVFGDGAAATLIRAADSTQPSMGPFLYGTDGSGGPHLIVPTSGARQPRTPETSRALEDEDGNVRSQDDLFMAGADIFNLTIQTAPRAVQDLIAKSGTSLEQIDLFVFHQANQYMLEHMRKRLQIPADKFVVSMAHCGNTVCSTIPIALKDAWDAGRLRSGMLVMLVGYGAGYSWGAMLMHW